VSRALPCRRRAHHPAQRAKPYLQALDADPSGFAHGLSALGSPDHLTAATRAQIIAVRCRLRRAANPVGQGPRTSAGPDDPDVPRRAGTLRADRSEDRRTLMRAGVTAVLAVNGSTAALAQARLA
jgi:hypothetical protein